MCYSNSSTATNVELGKRYKRHVPKELPELIYYHNNGFQYSPWRIITSECTIQQMNWGLVPSWFQGVSTEISSKTLNCRTETADSRASFKHILNSRRCIIPSSGFFEWQHQGKEKIPYFIYSSESILLSLAGLWDSHKDFKTGNQIQTFTILTTHANAFMSEIHNSKKRMPLFLNTDLEINNWLFGESEISSFIESSQKTLLSAHPVNKQLLLSSKSNVPEVKLPFENKQNQLSLF
jgi:putative SOS response-associated peptidase YedK